MAHDPAWRAREAVRHGEGRASKMNISQVGALAAAGGAALLGIGAVSIFSSGNPGLLVIVGGTMAVGAVGLLALAARLWLREPPTPARQGTRRGRPMPSVLTPGQRLGHIAIGALMLLMATHMLVTGRYEPVKGSVVTRQQQPGSYWTFVLLCAGLGGFVLRRGTRRPPEDHEDTPQPRPRQRRDADDGR